MATATEGTINGLWKGLAVTKDNRFVVLVYFDQGPEGLKGRFEAPEVSGQMSKGDLAISLDGNKIGFTTAGEIRFAGEIVGDDPRIIFGQVQSREGKPVGTLTLYQKGDELEDIFTAYLKLF